MMNRAIQTVVVMLVLVGLAAPGQADDLKQLVSKADMVLRGKTSAAVLKMTVKTKSYGRSYTIVSWDDMRNKDKDRTLIKILGPALWRGHGTLKIGSQLKLFNPRSNHVTVVGSSMLGDSWMGSHFSNDDLVKETRLARDFGQKLVKKWTGEAEGRGKVTWYRVDLTPKPTAPVAWGRITYTLWRDGDLVVPTRAEYFRKAGDKAPRRTLTFGDVKDLGGRTVPASMKMTVADKPGEYTEIVYKKLKFDIKIPDSKFTEQALKH